MNNVSFLTEKKALKSKIHSTCFFRQKKIDEHGIHICSSYIRYKFKVSESPDGLHDCGKVRSVHLDVSRKSLGPEALKPATTLADLYRVRGDSANNVGDLYGISCGTSMDNR